MTLAGIANQEKLEAVVVKTQPCQNLEKLEEKTLAKDKDLIDSDLDSELGVKKNRRRRSRRKVSA